MNRTCLIAGGIALAVATQPEAGWCQSGRMRVELHPRLTRLPVLQTARSDAGPLTGNRARQGVVLAGAAALVQATGGSLLETVTASLFRWRPAVTRRFEFAISRASLLTRFSDWRSIERLSPRLRDAARCFRFTVRYRF